jgi:PAS domain S-box-containing protein
MVWETRLLGIALAGGLPALVVACVALARGLADPFDRTLAIAALAAVWLAAGFAVRGRVVRALQTVANLLAALRERDYSIRAHGADARGALGLAIWELNALSDGMRQRRLEAREAGALLRHVMDSIDVALFGFDEGGRLTLVNREGEALLGMTEERALGRGAAALGLAVALAGDTPRLVDLRFPARAGRWELRRGEYRQDGRPSTLVALADLSRALREEEREAWMRLVRVLSHEINNSLAPIQSLAGTLRAMLERGGAAAAGGATGAGGAAAGAEGAAGAAATGAAGAGPPPAPPGMPTPRAADLVEGLGVIEGRARSLGRFMSAYATLTRLPKPALGTVDLGAVVRHAARLETRLAVDVAEGPAVALEADAAQLEHMLINLVRNAVDAALETGGGARVAWRLERGAVEIRVEDDGPGLADTENLFVPFYTTKEHGSGIGLALSRQIAEAHGGSVSLENRREGSGCVATVRLPVRRGMAPGMAPRGPNP